MALASLAATRRWPRGSLRPKTAMNLPSFSETMTQGRRMASRFSLAERGWCRAHPNAPSFTRHRPPRPPRPLAARRALPSCMRAPLRRPSDRCSSRRATRAAGGPSSPRPRSRRERPPPPALGLALGTASVPSCRPAPRPTEATPPPAHPPPPPHGSPSAWPALRARPHRPSTPAAQSQRRGRRPSPRASLRDAELGHPGWTHPRSALRGPQQTRRRGALGDALGRAARPPQIV